MESKRQKVKDSTGSSQGKQSAVTVAAASSVTDVKRNARATQVKDHAPSQASVGCHHGKPSAPVNGGTRIGRFTVVPYEVEKRGRFTIIRPQEDGSSSTSAAHSRFTVAPPEADNESDSESESSTDSDFYEESTGGEDMETIGEDEEVELRGKSIRLVDDYLIPYHLISSVDHNHQVLGGNENVQLIYHRSRKAKSHMILPISKLKPYLEFLPISPANSAKLLSDYPNLKAGLPSAGSPRTRLSREIPEWRYPVLREILSWIYTEESFCFISCDYDLAEMFIAAKYLGLGKLRASLERFGSYLVRLLESYRLGSPHRGRLLRFRLSELENFRPVYFKRSTNYYRGTGFPREGVNILKSQTLIVSPLKLADNDSYYLKESAIPDYQPPELQIGPVSIPDTTFKTYRLLVPRDDVVAGTMAFLKFGMVYTSNAASDRKIKTIRPVNGVEEPVGMVPRVRKHFRKTRLKGPQGFSLLLPQFSGLDALARVWGLRIHAGYVYSDMHITPNAKAKPAATSSPVTATGSLDEIYGLLQCIQCSSDADAPRGLAMALAVHRPRTKTFSVLFAYHSVIYFDLEHDSAVVAEDDVDAMMQLVERLRGKRNDERIGDVEAIRTIVELSNLPANPNHAWVFHPYPS